MEFKISDLENLKRLASQSKDAKSLAEALKKMYPNLAGESNVDGLSKALFR